LQQALLRKTNRRGSAGQALRKTNSKRNRRLRCGGAATVKLENSAERQKKLRNIETSTMGSIARQAISLKTQLTIKMTTSL
jgi:hypothetical protein